MVFAIKNGLDICQLLNSNICAYKMDSSEVEHFDRWPESHKNEKSSIKNYSRSFQELLHDEDAYDELFEKKFQRVEA